MRIVFLTVDYPEVVQSIYAGDAGEAARASYIDLDRRHRATLFSPGIARSVAALGHEAYEFHVNNLPLQRAWRRENVAAKADLRSNARKFQFYMRRNGSRARAVLQVLRSGKSGRLPTPQFDLRNPEIADIFAAQIRKLKPDIIYNFDPALIDGKLLKSLKSDASSLVAQIASPISPSVDWSVYDLVISSLPNFVERFRANGIPSSYFPLFFEPRVIDDIGVRERDIAFSFVGSVTAAHIERRNFLLRLAAELPLALFGSLQGEEEGTPLARAYHGPAWGRDMFAVMARSRLTINRHIDIAEGYANNMRLFEATGMGACLITERGRNLADLFEPGREVVAYDSVDECIELCRYYMNNPEAANLIAQAGQRRCLDEHNVDRRAGQLVALLNSRL